MIVKSILWLLQSFSNPFEQPYYYSAVSSMTSLYYHFESFHEYMGFAPKSSSIFEPETNELSPFKICIWTQFTVFLMLYSVLFWDNIVSFYSSCDGQVNVKVHGHHVGVFCLKVAFHGLFILGGACFYPASCYLGTYL